MDSSSEGQSMRLFSAGDVCRLTGTNYQSLDHWCQRGLVTPVSGGNRTGDHRRFGMLQLFAVYVGRAYRAEGADDTRIVGVVKYLNGLSLEWLEAEMEAGRTFPVPAGVLGKAHRPI